MSIVEKFYKNHVRIGAVAGNKYEINEEGRIVALKSFGGDVKEGDVGGFVASEANLSQEGNCWVYDNAKVSENAVVSGNAKVYGNARVDYEISYGEVTD